MNLFLAFFVTLIAPYPFVAYCVAWWQEPSVTALGWIGDSFMAILALAISTALSVAAFNAWRHFRKHGVMW